MNLPRALGVTVVAAVCMAAIPASGGVSFAVVYSFSGGLDGGFPWATLVQGSDGNLYGTADYGGTSSSILGHGTVFGIGLDGTFNPVYQFGGTPDGNHPYLSGLVEASDGTFYGTTVVGGDYNNGTIYNTDPTGFEFPVYSFLSSGGDGAAPNGGLVIDADDNLYGTTSSGGQYGYGTVFKVDVNWNYRRLFSFNGNNGAAPYARLTWGPDGGLYGTTLNGGTYFHGVDSTGNATGYGTVFRISTNGAFTSLFSFSSNDGALPVAGLTLAADGNFCGATELGGTNGSFGTIFRITTNGVFTSLFSFSSNNGAYPTGPLIAAADGTLYGTTADVPFLNGSGAPTVGSGTVFSLTPSGSLVTLHTFIGRDFGVEPVAGLLQASDGKFYGVTSGGGAYNYGTIFRLDVPRAPRLLSIQRSGQQTTLTWSSVVGQSYQLQFISDLQATLWNNLGAVILATNTISSAVDPAGSGPKRFYRVQVLP